MNLFNSRANVGLIQLTNTFNIGKHLIKVGSSKRKTYNNDFKKLQIYLIKLVLAVWLLLTLQLSYIQETTDTK